MNTRFQKVSLFDNLVNGIICWFVGDKYGIAIGFFCFGVLLTLDQILYTLRSIYAARQNNTVEEP